MEYTEYKTYIYVFIYINIAKNRYKASNISNSRKQPKKNIKYIKKNV